jgi:hypothetical protein
VAMRKTVLMFLAAVLLSACGDRTVTSLPTSSDSPSPVAAEEASLTSTASVDRPSESASQPAAASTSDEAELQSIEGMLREIEADLASVDQDLRTPEGDPTR